MRGREYEQNSTSSLCFLCFVLGELLTAFVLCDCGQSLRLGGGGVGRIKGDGSEFRRNPIRLSFPRPGFFSFTIFHPLVCVCVFFSPSLFLFWCGTEG